MIDENDKEALRKIIREELLKHSNSHMTADPLRCPFCGASTPRLRCDGIYWFVKCEPCGARVYQQFNGPDGKERAINAWNTRAICVPRGTGQ